MPASPGVKKAPVPGGAEAGAVPPVGLEPTTVGVVRQCRPAARGSVSVLETARRAEDPNCQYHHGSGSSARQKDSGGNAITTIPNLVAGILVVGHGKN